MEFLQHWKIRNKILITPVITGIIMTCWVIFYLVPLFPKSVLGQTDQSLKGSVQISSELVSKSTFLATRTKELIGLMNEIIIKSEQNRSVADEVEAVSAELARKSESLRGTLGRFRT